MQQFFAIRIHESVNFELDHQLSQDIKCKESEIEKCFIRKISFLNDSKC